MMLWQSSGPFDHVLLLTIMGATFNVIIIIKHATTCYCCETLRKTKLEIDIDATIEEFGRTNRRRLKMAKILSESVKKN